MNATTNFSSRRCRYHPHTVTRFNRAGRFNVKGNAGRGYYECTHSECQRRNRGFVTWADNNGVHNINPYCRCGIPTRVQIGRLGSRPVLRRFWNCANATCGFWLGETVEFGWLFIDDLKWMGYI
ncbi:hypothetical protein K440DRAFT_625692 [Wilcoxina mikolae CBS 423.85]|nr:hypothetical protein K440DRAFT_625692 [Wilcoxina mikolae CBS 423.85]